ncbi:hypothetical protein H2O14_24515 [Rhizobium sp. G21]|nr:hypothetical protein [Rhizobium sp. G21]
MAGDMDGLTLVKTVRQRYPAMPFLITSGYADALDAAMRAKFADHLLAKPYRQRDLAAKLKALLPQRGASGSR